MTMRPLEDQFVKKRGGPMKKRYETCVATADTDETILFGMDDRGCWRSTAASQHSYDSLGSSKECKKRGSYQTGKMESNTVFVYKKKEGNKVDKGILTHKLLSLTLPKSCLLLFFWNRESS